MDQAEAYEIADWLLDHRELRDVDPDVLATIKADIAQELRAAAGYKEES